MSRENNARRELLAPGTTFMVTDNEVTHAVVPIETFEKLIEKDEALEHVGAFDDDEGPWIPLEDAMAQIAASHIIKARKAAGMTQQQLAAKLKMPQSQISRIERNPDRTTVRTLKKIAKALKVDVRFLI